MPDYVFDTTALSNFGAAQNLDLLQQRYAGAAFTTVEVVDELRKGVKAGYSHLAQVLDQIETINSKGWLQVVTPSVADEYQLRFRFDSMLDPGEASCLAIAVSRQMILVTDDLAARKLAKDNNVALSGTLGILIALVRHKIISLSRANQFLSRMIQNHYRSPVNRLDDLI